MMQILKFERRIRKVKSSLIVACVFWSFVVTSWKMWQDFYIKERTMIFFAKTNQKNLSFLALDLGIFAA